MLKKLKNMIYSYRLKRKIAKANELHRLTKFKYMVIKYNRRLMVVSKRQVKQLVKTGFFKRRVTCRQIEKMALYVT